MFNNGYNNPSSIFSSPQSSNSQIDFDAKLMELQQMKNQMQQAQTPNQQHGIRSVFDDISDEWKSLAEDERNFIESTKEYRELNNQYQQDFNAFLMATIGPDFLKSKYGATPERILAVIREKKDQYKSKFAQDIHDIRDQNSTLIDKNDELAKINISLQEQLLSIQQQINGGKK